MRGKAVESKVRAHPRWLTRAPNIAHLLRQLDDACFCNEGSSKNVWTRVRNPTFTQSWGKIYRARSVTRHSTAWRCNASDVISKAASDVWYLTYQVHIKTKITKTFGHSAWCSVGCCQKYWQPYHSPSQRQSKSLPRRYFSPWDSRAAGRDGRLFWIFFLLITRQTQREPLSVRLRTALRRLYYKVHSATYPTYRQY